MHAFSVRRTMCNTCIYKPDCVLDMQAIEDAVHDERGFMVKWRECHHHPDRQRCCRGFWERHRHECGPTRLALRLQVVEFSDAGDWLDAWTS